MKTVNVHAKVDMELCKGCENCQMVCPGYAVKMEQDKVMEVFNGPH